VIERQHRPRALRRHVEPPTPGHERRRRPLVISKPPVPPNRMTPSEIDAWAGEIVGERVRAVAAACAGRVVGRRRVGKPEPLPTKVLTSGGAT